MADLAARSLTVRLSSKCSCTHATVSANRFELSIVGSDHVFEDALHALVALA